MDAFTAGCFAASVAATQSEDAIPLLIMYPSLAPQRTERFAPSQDPPGFDRERFLSEMNERIASFLKRVFNLQP